jgi:hypothetical protein
LLTPRASRLASRHDSRVTFNPVVTTGSGGTTQLRDLHPAQNPDDPFVGSGNSGALNALSLSDIQVLSAYYYYTASNPYLNRIHLMPPRMRRTLILMYLLPPRIMGILLGILELLQLLRLALHSSRQRLVLSQQAKQQAARLLIFSLSTRLMVTKESANSACKLPFFCLLLKLKD